MLFMRFPYKNTRIVVGMSGGVDSSVVACLLQQQGAQVIGMTICFSLPESRTRRPRCCGLQGIEDARRVCQQLGIPHYVVPLQETLEQEVIQEFCQEYAHGRTPNPCVRCNQFIKFGALLDKARALDAAYLATGHYARRQQSVRGVFKLQKAADQLKDQSYFLYRLSQKQLAHILFPLGEFTKKQVRLVARAQGLAVAEKQESQEICFIPRDNYREFLADRIGAHIKRGDFVDGQGRVLGRHQGVAFYTIGQRQGLGIAAAHPLYVVAIDAGRNTIILGKKEDCMRDGCLVSDMHWVHKPIEKKIALQVKIRYNHPGVTASVFPQKDSLRVVFKEPQFAVTPGQSAVLYRTDVVVGGGIILQSF